MNTPPVPANHATLSDVVARFADEFAEPLSRPEIARDRCQPISEHFATLCQEAGIDATTISGSEFGEVPEFPGMRLILNGHFAVLIPTRDGDVVYDWTARQFDPEAAVPQIVTLDEWRTRWQTLA